MENKYVTLVGNIQSGKTLELLNYCYQSTVYQKTPVVFVLRNITADQLQLKHRIDEYNVLLDDSKKLKMKTLSQLSLITGIEFLKEVGIIIVLCNNFQLNDIIEILAEYSSKYNVCIDEIDYSIKSKDYKAKTDVLMKIIKDNANHIVGATATPFAVFSTEKKMSKVKKLKPNQNYKGISDLDVMFVDSKILDGALFPHCDHLAMTEIYTNLLSKPECVLLHTVVKKKIQHYRLATYISNKYKKFSVLIYNGDGIRLFCPERNSDKPLAPPISSNKYKQVINKYYFLENEHIFINYSISEVLQILKDDPYHKHSYVSIISGHLASRGISFVSSDYSIHLTDQYLYTSPKAHGENILQSLRILGCYKDSGKITLWCSNSTWRHILEQQKIINQFVNSCNESTNWLNTIKKITVNKPKNKLTRPALSKGMYFTGINTDEYILDIQHHLSEDEEESEIN